MGRFLSYNLSLWKLKIGHLQRRKRLFQQLHCSYKTKLSLNAGMCRLLVLTSGVRWSITICYSSQSYCMCSFFGTKNFGCLPWELRLRRSDARVRRVLLRLCALSETSACSRSAEKSESSVPSELLPAVLWKQQLEATLSDSARRPDCKPLIWDQFAFAFFFL